MSNQEQLSDAKRQLLDRVLRGEFARQCSKDPIPPRDSPAAAPLAPSQRLVWLHSQMGDSAVTYNEPVAIHFHGKLDPLVFERAFYEILRRHQIWRTTFASVDGQVLQVVHDRLDIKIPFIDLSALPEPERGAEELRLALEDARRPFDPAVGPLLRGRLYKLADDLYRFHLTLHHLIFDGVTLYDVVLPDLEAIYDAFAKNLPSPLPDPALQYSDFALWQHRLVEGPALTPQRAYWKKQLAPPPGGSLPSAELPFDHPRPPRASFRGATERYILPHSLIDAVNAASKREAVTPYMFLLASFQALLHRYSGQQDLLVGGITDLRRRPEFQRMAGYFLNTLVMRTHPRGDLRFRDYLAEVKEAVISAVSNGDVPFDELVRDLLPKRDLTRHPFFQVLFSLQPAAPLKDSPWRMTQLDFSVGASKIDLYLELEPCAEGMIVRWAYNTDLFERSTILRMIGHWRTVLEAALDDSGTLLQNLPLLTAEESDWLQIASEGPQLDLPPVTVHGLVASQVARTPTAIAIESGGEATTYRELDAWSTGIAAQLRDAGARDGAVVAVCVGRSARTAAALLAVLKAGAVYLPIDPGLPRDRIALLLEDAQVQVILAERSCAAHLPDTRATIVYVGSGLASTDAVAPTNDPESLAYVIHTSGSTGKPKGVAIPHSAAVNLLLAMQREPGFAAGDRLLAVTTVSFDIAALEIFLPLITGGTVIMASHDEARDPERLERLMRVSRPTIMQATPATWRALIENGWNGPRAYSGPPLRVLCGGEALPRDLAHSLLERGVELWNVYGPTETTIWSTVHRVRSATGALPIGRPIANTQVQILDANFNRQPVGVVGELYIGGAGVARGYLRREQLTLQRFIPSPFDPSARLYRTGDLARWLPDGSIECLGRADNQVKIRGFRVELEEVESALLSVSGVKQAAARIWKDESSEASLAAYIVGEHGLALKSVQQHLLRKLPEYMVPSRFIVIDALPLTPNGKIDRAALPHPGSQDDARFPAVPASPTEQRLAAIFESILRVDSVRLQDSFFDLGGHSLLVAKLLRRIELEFGIRLTMPAVFQSPTIELLAARLDSPGYLASRPRVVDIRDARHVPDSAASPFFWMYAGPFFHALASRIDVSHPLVDVSLEAKDYAALPSSPDLPTIAAPLVRRIRQLQPQGPYHVGGWCVGGLIAFEVAQQLAAAGEQVDLVALVDAPNPVYYLSIPKWRVYISKLRYNVTRLRRLSFAAAWDYAIERVLRIGLKLSPPSPEVTGSFEGMMNNAALRYVPKPLDARVALFRPAERPDAPDLLTGWTHVLGDQIEVQEIPGDHVSIFLEPCVEALAAGINCCLGDAQLTVEPAKGVAETG